MAQYGEDFIVDRDEAYRNRIIYVYFLFFWRDLSLTICTLEDDFEITFHEQTRKKRNAALL